MGLPGGAGLPGPQGGFKGGFPGRLKIYLDPDNQTWHRPSSNYFAQVLSFSSLQESLLARPSKEIESLDKHRCAQKHFRCCSALVKESIVGDGDGGDDDDGDGDGVESIMMMMQVPEVERGGC